MNAIVTATRTVVTGTVIVIVTVTVTIVATEIVTATATVTATESVVARDLAALVVAGLAPAPRAAHGTNVLDAQGKGSSVYLPSQVFRLRFVGVIKQFMCFCCVILLRAQLCSRSVELV